MEKFGTHKGLEQSRSIDDAHWYLKERWPILREKFKHATGNDLFLTCTYRSPAIQALLYAKGRTVPGDVVTNIDGVSRLSEHNVYPSRAIDVCVDVDASDMKIVPSWRTDLYKALGPICVELGLTWGGAWTRFPDMPHVELPRDIP